MIKIKIHVSLIIKNQRRAQNNFFFILNNLNIN